MVTFSKIRWVLSNKIKSRLQRGQTTAIVLEDNGSGLIYHHSNGKEITTIIKFSGEDELDVILESLMRKKTEYKDGTIQEVKTNKRKAGYYNRTEEQGQITTNSHKLGNLSDSDIGLDLRSQRNLPFDPD